MIRDSGRAIKINLNLTYLGRGDAGMRPRGFCDRYDKPA